MFIYRNIGARELMALLVAAARSYRTGPAAKDSRTPRDTGGVVRRFPCSSRESGRSERESHV